MADLDPEFADLAKASGLQNAAAMSHAVAGATQQTFQNDPTQGMSWGQTQLAGLGQGMTDFARHAGNLVGLVSDQELKDAKQRDAPLMNASGGLAPALGQSIASAPLSMGVGGALARIAPSLGPISSSAIQGAVQGGLSADPGQRLQGMGVGAGMGALLPTGSALLGKMASGVERTPAAQALMNVLPKGTLTPGQMNPTGPANRMEQALEGVAGVGDLVQNARDNSMHQYTRAMVQRSMAPGATLPRNATNINDMIDAAGKSFDTAYDAGKGFPVGAKIMNQNGPDVALTQALKSVTVRARPGMGSKDQASIGNNLQDLLNQTIQDAKRKGGMQSDDLLAYRSTIRDLIRGEDGLTNASRATKKLYQDAADKVTEAINSQLPKDAAQALQATDAQYGKFKVIQDAAAAAKDKPGGPTPFQISTAIAKATPKSVYAAGGGANRDLSQAAAETFQNNVPRTGLAGMGRLALPLAAAGGLAKAGIIGAHPVPAALTGAGMAGMAGLSLTPWGRQLAGGQTGLQQALAAKFAALDKMIPQSAQHIGGAYARGSLTGLMSPRLQQMPTDQ